MGKSEDKVGLLQTNGSTKKSYVSLRLKKIYSRFLATF